MRDNLEEEPEDRKHDPDVSSATYQTKVTATKVKKTISTLAEVVQLRRSKLNISIRNKNGYKDLDSLRYLMTVITDEAQLKARSQLHQY